MTTCCERLRKTLDQGETYKRLEGYFRALENDELEVYHDKQDQKKKNMRRDKPLWQGKD